MIAAEYVSDARARLRISQAALARLIGVNPRTVARWEAGETRPGERHLLAIAQLLLLSRGQGPVDRRDAALALMSARV